MERLTKKEHLAGHDLAYVSEEDCFDVWSVPKKFMGNAIDRLSIIEDILGDDYDIDRLRELIEADRDGRCVIIPVRGYTDKDGEQALNSAMNTCFYHNNSVTRYIADAVAEKLTREATESALKGEQND